MSRYSETVLCECGCGLPAPLSKQTDSRRGFVKDQPHRFRMGHNQRGRARVSGYKLTQATTHPRASGHGYVLEHVLIVEAALGKYLPAGAEVHHVDGNSLNNSRRNLVVCPSRAYHKLLHVRQRILAAGGDPNTQRPCSTCRQFKPFAEFYSAKTPYGFQKRCKDCCKAYDKGRWRRGPKSMRAA
jgi:hypothetical protein